MRSFLTFLSEQRSGGGAGAWMGRAISRDGPSLPFSTLMRQRGLNVRNPIQDTVGPFSGAARVGSKALEAANTVRTLGVNQLSKPLQTITTGTALQGPARTLRTAINNAPAVGAGLYAINKTLGQENQDAKRTLANFDTGINPDEAGLTNANIAGAALRTAQRLNPRELTNVSTSQQVRGRVGTALTNVVNRAAAGNINALTTAASEIRGNNVSPPRIPGSDTVANRINQSLGQARNTPMQDYDLETAGVVGAAELAKGADIQASDKEGLERFIGNYLTKRRRLVGPDVVTTRRGRIVNPGQMADSGRGLESRIQANLQMLAKSMNDE